jgi:hypothetical protein
MEPVVDLSSNPDQNESPFCAELARIEMFPPPDRILMLLAAVPKLIPFTPAVVLTTGPVGLEVPAAPPPKMMFPVAMETAASQLALVFMHTELPMEMDPLPPEELAHNTMSAPLVW